VASLPQLKNMEVKSDRPDTEVRENPVGSARHEQVAADPPQVASSSSVQDARGLHHNR
jgi:hypothetical protein